MVRKETKELLVGASLVLAIVCVLFYVNQLLRTSFFETDFRTFWAASEILSREPVNLYDAQTQLDYQRRIVLNDGKSELLELVPFYNPPFYLIGLLPFMSFSPQNVYSGTMIANLVLLGACCWVLMSLTVLPRNVILVASSLMISFAPVYQTFLHSQNSLLSLLLFVLIGMCIKKKRYLLAGLVGSLLLYKPQLGIWLFVYFVALREWRLIVGFGLGGSLLFLSSWLMMGNALFSIIGFVSSYAFTEGAAPMNEISLVGLLWQIKYVFGDFPIITMIKIVSLLSFVGGCWWIYRLRDLSIWHVLSVVTLLGLVAGGHAHYQEGALLLLPFVVLLGELYKELAFWIVTAVVWIVLFVAVFMANAGVVFLWIPNFVVLGVIFIFLKINSRRLI